MRKNHNALFKAGQLSLLLLLVLFTAGCFPGETIARGWSGPTVVDGIIYIGSMDGKIVSLNASDGRRIWEAPLEIAAPSGGFGCAAPPTAVAIYGSPAVSGNVVYLGGYNNGKFYAFAPGEREPRWVYPREGMSATQLVGGALVSEGKVFFGTASGKVYALNAATGASSTGWIFPSGSSAIGKIWSAPAALEGTLFVSAFDRKLYALDIATGEKRWTFETGGALVAAPVAENNTVYIGSFDRNLYAVDAATGKERWRFSGAKNWFWARPVIKDGIIYAPNLDGKVYALTLEGASLGVFDLGSGAISASPVLAENALIVVSESGNVSRIDTTLSRTGATTNAIKHLKYIGEKVDAALAGDGTAVYIHTGIGRLYAVNAQTGAEMWSPVSLKTAPPPAASNESAGTNWGLIISIIGVGILVLLVLNLLGKRIKP